VIAKAVMMMMRINQMFKEWLFIKLLRWFCTRRLDQWERWKIPTKYGPVYVSISREGDGYDYTEFK